MKKYKNQMDLLDSAILVLQNKRDHEFNDLKSQLHNVYESVKPINILKQTITEFKTSPDIKSNLLQTAISLGGGYLSKKVLLGNTHSLFKKILGYVLQYGVTNYISKKVDPEPKDK